MYYSVYINNAILHGGSVQHDWGHNSTHIIVNDRLNAPIIRVETYMDVV